jgi:hypothetical protein
MIRILDVLVVWEFAVVFVTAKNHHHIFIVRFIRYARTKRK